MTQLDKIISEKPHTLAEVIAITGETPDAAIAAKLPDALHAAGWSDVHGEGTAWFQATSKDGEVIHFADGKLHTGARKDEDQ